MTTASLSGSRVVFRARLATSDSIKRSTEWLVGVGKGGPYGQDNHRSVKTARWRRHSSISHESVAAAARHPHRRLAVITYSTAVISQRKSPPLMLHFVVRGPRRRYSIDRVK